VYLVFVGLVGTVYRTLHIYIYVYIYIYVCVCVFISVRLRLLDSMYCYLLSCALDFLCIPLQFCVSCALLLTKRKEL
jgi:hypothetical protein